MTNMGWEAPLSRLQGQEDTEAPVTCRTGQLVTLAKSWPLSQARSVVKFLWSLSPE